MFCNKCGKQISDNSVFCTWCGAKNSDTTPTPAAVSQPAEPIPASVPVGAPAVSEPAAEPSAVSMKLPEEPEKLSSIPVSSTPAGQENSHKPMMEVPLCDPLPENAKKPKSERLYTRGQIALCLVLMGIMAAVAGVFAGLYFSVI